MNQRLIKCFISVLYEALSAFFLSGRGRGGGNGRRWVHLSVLGCSFVEKKANQLDAGLANFTGVSKRGCDHDRGRIASIKGVRSIRFGAGYWGLGILPDALAFLRGSSSTINQGFGAKHRYSAKRWGAHCQGRLVFQPQKKGWQAIPIHIDLLVVRLNPIFPLWLAVR